MKKGFRFQVSGFRFVIIAILFLLTAHCSLLTASAQNARTLWKSSGSGAPSNPCTVSFLYTQVYVDSLTSKTYTCKSSDGNPSTSGTWTEVVAAAGGVTGPASSTAGDVPTFSDTTGKVLQAAAAPTATVKLTETAPGAATVALAGAGAGNVTNGAHTVKVTCATAGGQTSLGTASSTVTVTDNTVNGKVAISAIPLCSAIATGRKVYMATVAAPTVYKLLSNGTIADNTTTTLTANDSDATLAASTTGPSTNTAIDARLTVGQSVITPAVPLAAFTLNGTVSGAGNQINNVIIGTSTPLAGSFTTVTGSTSVTSPIYTSAAAVSVTTSSNNNITLTPNGTGIISAGKAIVAPNNSLTDNGSTIATDASLGNNFRVGALTANVTLSNPTNPTDGQVATWEVIQNASVAKTLAFGTAFGFGAEIAGCTISVTLSSHNFITAIYNSTATKWYVRGCITGY